MSREYVQNYDEQERLIRSNIESAKIEGMSLGHAKEKLKIAKMLIKNTNTTPKEISLCTGLSIEEITKLKKRN